MKQHHLVGSTEKTWSITNNHCENGTNYLNSGKLTLFMSNVSLYFSIKTIDTLPRTVWQPCNCCKLRGSLRASTSPHTLPSTDVFIIATKHIKAINECRNFSKLLENAIFSDGSFRWHCFDSSNHKTVHKTTVAGQKNLIDVREKKLEPNAFDSACDFTIPLWFHFSLIEHKCNRFGAKCMPTPRHSKYICPIWIRCLLLFRLMRWLQSNRVVYVKLSQSRLSLCMCVFWVFSPELLFFYGSSHLIRSLWRVVSIKTDTHNVYNSSISLDCAVFLLFVGWFVVLLLFSKRFWSVIDGNDTMLTVLPIKINYSKRLLLLRIALPLLSVTTVVCELCKCSCFFSQRSFGTYLYTYILGRYENFFVSLSG